MTRYSDQYVSNVSSRILIIDDLDERVLDVNGSRALDRDLLKLNRALILFNKKNSCVFDGDGDVDDRRRSSWLDVQALDGRWRDLLLKNDLKDQFLTNSICRRRSSASNGDDVRWCAILAARSRRFLPYFHLFDIDLDWRSISNVFIFFWIFKKVSDNFVVKVTSGRIRGESNLNVP